MIVMQRKTVKINTLALPSAPAPIPGNGAGKSPFPPADPRAAVRPTAPVRALLSLLCGPLACLFLLLSPTAQGAPASAPASTPAAAPAATAPPLGFAPYIVGAERAAVPTTLLRCAPVAQVPSREVCGGTWYTADPNKILLVGVWLSEFQLLFSDNHLVKVDATFDSRRFDQVCDSLTRQYGPSEDGGDVISGGYGVRIAGRRHVWRLATGVIVAREAAGVVHYSSVKYYAPGWAPMLPVVPPAAAKTTAR